MTLALTLAHASAARAEAPLMAVDFMPRPVTQAPHPRKLPPAGPPPAPAADDGPSRRTVAIAAAVVGGLSAGLGVTAGALALHDKSTFDAHPTDAVASRGNEEAVLADVGVGAAVIAATTSIVLFLTSDPAAPPLHHVPGVPERVPGPFSVSVTPATPGHGVGLGVVVIF